MGKRYRLDQEQEIPASKEEVFLFFSDAQNLERLTPPFLGFRILTPGPIHIEEGTLIDYRIKLHGLPMKWRTRIDAFKPNDYFTDTQLKGPYKYWHHKHTFFETKTGTRIVDEIDYELPFGPIGSIAHHVMVRNQLRAIFEFRRQAIGETFPGSLGSEPISENDT